MTQLSPLPSPWRVVLHPQKGIVTSQKKLDLVLFPLRNRTVNYALKLAQLDQRKASLDVVKALKCARASATQTGRDPDRLVVGGSCTSENTHEKHGWDADILVSQSRTFTYTHMFIQTYMFNTLERQCQRDMHPHTPHTQIDTDTHRHTQTHRHAHTHR